MSHSVVKVFYEKSIGIVAMEDRDSKNTFSPGLVRGLTDAFDDIRQHPETKVVVIHGYDNYFCCGGTKEELISMVKGNLRFPDMNLHDLLLNAEIPVISAMQGHALGGGLVFGCYADIVVMGEECVYNANFMKYGFTPGFGATYILPEKFGTLLGSEMLFRAGNYFGRELRERGVGAKVVPKKEVIGTAMKIAGELADKSLPALKLLKECLSRPIRSRLADVVAGEVRMHDLTFSQPEVIRSIEALP